MPVSTSLCKHFIGFVALLVVGCGAATPVRVLKENETVVGASIGGPFVPSSVPSALIPYATFGLAHGVTEDVTVGGNLHVLMAAFGVIGFDVGASGRLLKQERALPEVTLGARMFSFTDLWTMENVRLYPDANLTLSWDVFTDCLAYGGAHTTFQWSPYLFLLSPYVGFQFPLSKSVSLQTELMWQASNVDTRHGVFEGKSSIGGTGSIGGFIGVLINI